MKKWISNIVDNMFGKPAAAPDPVPFIRPNRKQQRAAAAQRQAAGAEPNRRKYEKRGAPGRSSKGRKPHRHA